MDFFRSFKAPSKFAQEFLLFSDGLGHMRSEDFFIDRNVFNNNLLMYVLSGKLHVEQNGHLVLQQNQGVIMRLTNKHKYYTDPHDTCEILWMHFHGRQCEPIMKYIEETHKLPAIFAQPKVADLIEQSFKFYNNRDMDSELLLSQNIYSMLISILQTLCSKNELQSIDPRVEFMNKAIAFVDSNVYNKISLYDFACAFNLSIFHFCRTFEKHFNIPPMKFVQMKKIEFSKYLLLYTNEPISSIASSLGFTDQSHYSKVFKALQSKSPLNYRKESGY